VLIAEIHPIFSTMETTNKKQL